jgi:lipopolysaccharide heptosyltransferase II
MAIPLHKKIFWKLLYIREIAKTKLQRLIDRGGIDHNRIRSILAVRLYGIGNMVLATPALRALRNGYPGSKITVMVSENGAGEVVSGSGVVDSAISFDYAHTVDMGLVKKLRSEHFDLLVVFYPMGVVDLPLVTASAGIRYRFGFRDAVKGNLYTHPFDLDYRRGEGRSNLDLACRAGGKPGGGPFFFIGPADRKRIDRFFADNRIRADETVISMHPGSQEMRRWPKEHFAAIGDRFLRDYRARVVLLGGPGEEVLCRDISELMQSRPIVATGLALKETAEVIRRSALFVGNDSGLMHVASAVRTSLIGLFGPTDSVKSRPWGGRNKTVILRSRMKCAPCYRSGAIPCIYGRNLCMAGISVQRVYDQSKSLLSGRSAVRQTEKGFPKNAD